jgi:hypothetical protein
MRGAVHQLEAGAAAETAVDQPARPGIPNYVFRALCAAKEFQIPSWLAIFDHVASG